jgi:hypothetical protein
MAKIIQEKVTITFSKMVKDSDDKSYVMNEEILTVIDKVLGEIGDKYNIMIELGGE